MATTLSPLSIGSSRSLSPRRRGSMAAPDPYGIFPDTDRTVTSTLHIVKAPHNVVQDLPQDKTRRQTRTRSSTHSGGITGQRISFAFSGFNSQRDLSAPRSAIEPTRPVSPANAKPLFPRSNSFTNISMLSHTPLTPIQVYDFAQQCNNPHSRPSTPVPHTSLPASPVTFTPLPETHLLPFLDRPSEVKDLLSRPLTAKLFMLLAQTFPVRTPSTSDADPSSWTYVQLEHWLTQTGRDQADDVEWVQKARLCIAARSELIWERVKAALGVPPELDGSIEQADGQNGAMPDKPERLLDDEDLSESFGNAWVEPIVATPTASSPVPSRSPTTPFSRSPSLGHQGVGRMEDISEDAPESDPTLPPPAATVHGLRLVVSPSEPPDRRYSGSSSTSSYAGSFSQPHVPYDAVGERGPGHPLFPSSFANLALGPTLQANNPSLRTPSAPPPSAFSPSQPTLQRRRHVPSWAEGWDPQTQEYALSISEQSRKSVPVGE